MSYRLFWRLLQIAFFVLIVSSSAFGQVAHGIKVKLQPETHLIEVVDKITLPPELLKSKQIIMVILIELFMPLNLEINFMSFMFSRKNRKKVFQLQNPI